MRVVGRDDELIVVQLSELIAQSRDTPVEELDVMVDEIPIEAIERVTNQEGFTELSFAVKGYDVTVTPEQIRLE